MRFIKSANEIICSFTISPVGPVIISDSGYKAESHFLSSTVNGEKTYVIPGSSLKGVIRNYASGFLGPAKMRNLFGRKSSQGTSVKSKITFHDAFADMNTIKTDNCCNTAVTEAGKSALNSVEAVIAGDFIGGFKLINADETEFLYVIEAINALNDGKLCIGGRKSHDFGRVEIRNFRLVVYNGFDSDLRPVISGEYCDICTLLADIKGGKIKLTTDETKEEHQIYRQPKL